MTRMIRMALAAALVLPALPALGYDEAFTSLNQPERKPTPVQVTGRYSEGYVSEEAAPARLQSAPAVAGNYTEQFVEPGAPARAATAQARPAPGKTSVAARR